MLFVLIIVNGLLGNTSWSQLLKTSKIQPKSAKNQVAVNPHLQAARKYFKEEFFNAALFHLMELVKEEPQKINQWAELIDKVLDKTGTLPLYVYDANFLQQIKSSTISLHLAHLAYKAKKYDEALTRLNRVESNQNFMALKYFIRGIQTQTAMISKTLFLKAPLS